MRAASLLIALLLVSPAAAQQGKPEAGDLQIAVTIRFLSSSDHDKYFKVAENLGTPCKGDDDIRLLDEAGLRQLLEEVYRVERNHVLSAPLIKAGDGQSAVWEMLDKRQFKTGMDIVREGEHHVFRSHAEEIATGMRIQVNPRVSPDRRLVLLGLDASLITIDDDVPLVPVSSTCKVAIVERREVQTVPCTYYLELPKIQTMQAKKTLAIPEGGSALFAAWKETREGRNEFGPPVIGKFPWVNRLFKNTAYDRATYTTYFLVTPQIIANPARTDAAILLPPFSSEPMPRTASRGIPAQR